MLRLCHLGVENVITLITSMCEIMPLYVKIANMLMLSFVSACVHLFLSSLCLLLILYSPNLYSGQVVSRTDPQLSN